MPGTVPTDLEWYRQLRVIQLRDDTLDGTWLVTQSATVSGVGYVNHANRMHAPLHHDCCFSDDGVGSLMSYIRFRDPASGTWSFDVHELCWQILLQRVPEGRSDLTKFSTLLFQMLFCTTWGKHRYLRPGHDFGGAAQFQKPVGAVIHDMIDQGFDYLSACPSQFRNMAEILSFATPDTQFCPQQSTHRAWRPSPRDDIFSSLPVEVLLMIVSVLPSPDIQQLRLASRSLASATDPSSLPQFFWRTRFLADGEMGFAWPANSTGDLNWRDAYFTLKHALSDSSGSNFAQARNRRRIWRLAGINAALLSQFLNGTDLCGSICSGLSQSPNTTTENGTHGEMLSAQVSEDSHRLLSVGSLRLHDRSVILPLNDFTLKTIRVYVVYFNLQCFISGLKFELLNLSTQALSDIALGFTPPNAGHLIQIAPSVCVTGLELEVNSRGITNLRVLVEGSDHGACPPQWVRDQETDRADIALGKLNFGAMKARRIRLVAKFDAFKMIALGFTEASDTVSENDNSFTLQPIWTPTYPREAVSLVPELQPALQGYNRMLNIHFAGANGEKLPQLTRIVTHILNDSAPIVGFTFYFDNRTSTHFGRQGLMEVSLLIDGPRGEYVTGVTVAKSTKDSRILLLRMCTNLGNELITGWDELSRSEVSDYRLRVHPYDSRSNPLIKGKEMTIKAMQAPIGQRITGFIATLETSHHSFCGFGLQCEETPPPYETRVTGTVSHLPVSTAACLASTLGSYIITERSNCCRAFTSASLKSVKCIKFSSGDLERPRLSNEISGVWLDYFESPDSIVGQWISESASITLEHGETITGITIWLSNGRMSLSQEFFMGRVIRIMITTSIQTVVYPEGPPLPAHEHTILRFEENYLEELSCLVWVFNDSWDFPRVIRSPKSPSQKMVFWDPCHTLKTRPWAVPQRALWAGDNGTDHLVSISGYRNLNKENYITGLRFSYKTGAVRDIGDVAAGQALRSVRLSPDEDVQRMSLIRDWTGLLQITFHFIKRGEHAKTRRALIATPSAKRNLPSMAGRTDHEDVDFLQRRYTSHYRRAAGNAQSKEGDLPRGEIVGLWGRKNPDAKLHVGVVMLQNSRPSAKGAKASSLR
ncbi:hypothetical protein BO82DRAFT_431670 [Aspergillus uvarum CBS 121591]|uniref:F-box domain-containing protein n=1 Tax=Aspergillus uvarum CBS 121591 TaxID=1448315 RepID=A0A319CDB7_9EURO|nr:hypothetical protein BO82DRAFT_431670 [Aspergillus uvarum CBS 121591]PYH82430.1 hypothetical protein BO82DRAFT_431670 [Aspergillus uvarum CBS 121591]